MGRAINAFGKFTKSYAEKNPGTTKNLSFIEFWQDPDGYLEGWWRQNGNGKTLLGEFWRIGDVAALDAIDEEVTVAVNESVAFARASEFPPVSALTTDVYVKYQ